MASRPERVITYRDYVTLPDEPRLEVIGGEAHVVASPNTRHQKVVSRLHGEIYAFLKTHVGGEVFVAPFDVVLSDTDIVQPDIVFIAENRLEILTDANARGVPTWVIEVLSPSDPARDQQLKLELYERTGVPEYWIADPEQRTITVHRLHEGLYGTPEVFAGGRVARYQLVSSTLVVDLDDLFVGT